MADILRQRNKRTGEIRISTDGGATWQSQGIQTRGPDPLLPSRVTKANNDAAASVVAPAQANANLQKTQSEIRNDAANIELERRKFLVALAEKGLTFDDKGNVVPLPSGPIDSGAKKSVAQQDLNADHTIRQIDVARRQIDAGHDTGNVFGSKGFQSVPYFGQNSANLGATLSGLQGSVINDTLQQLKQLSATGASGYGSLSETEAERLAASVAALQQTQDAASLKSNLDELEKHYRSARAIINGEDPRDPAVAKRYGIAGDAPPTVPGQGNQVVLNGSAQTRAELDPVMMAASKRVGTMIASGVSGDKIKQYMANNGINPADTSIDDVLRFRQTSDFANWRRQNPNAAYPIGPSFYTKQVPVGALRNTLNSAIKTDVGGALAAAPVAAANAIVGDRLASMSGDPLASIGMAQLRQNHPIASLLGDVAGQVSDEALLGRIPGAQGLLATRAGRRAGDFAYGAFSGSGDSSNGDPLSGALTGGFTNTLGGMLGRGVQRGAGKALTGVRDAQVGYLDRAGVPLTVGQIGHGSENTLGKIVGGIEDRAAGLPGFDAVINAARHRGLQGFNTAAFREAGGSGATGAAGLGEINALKNNAYSFLDGTNIPIDAQFAGRNAAVSAAIPDMPAFGNEVGATLGQLDKISKNGQIAGRDFQSAVSDIRGDRSSLAGKPFASNAVRNMKEIENNVLELADRQGPAGTVDNLNAANRLNAQAQTLAGALDNGPAQRNDQLFSPQKLDDVSRINTRKFGGRMASLMGNNRPFYELSQSGIDVMPNVVPDSGTGGRLALIPLAAAVPGTIGAAIGAGSSDDRAHGASVGGTIGSTGYLGALTLASLLYSKPGQKVLQKALVGSRPDRITKLGDFLINNAGFGGALGSGVARQRNYTLADLLPQ